MASTAPQSTPVMLDMAMPIVTGAVWATAEVKINGNKYSFHAAIATNIVTAAIPGAANGNVIKTNAFNFEHPSIRADSSNDMGMSSMNVFMSQVARLTEKVQTINMRVTCLSMRPRALKIGNRGMVIIIGGNILIAMRNSEGTFSHLLLKREKAKAAAKETINVNTTAPIVMTTVLSKLGKNRSWTAAIRV